MDNIKQVVKDIRFLIATNCCDETIQARIENFINERDQALRIHNVSRQSELLNAFVEFYNNRQNRDKWICYDEIDIYLESL